ncbi:MAG: sigma-70 family RNA polymerase sigma factor [bacterium]|nr:sigma-70 family RNA polymerase sigma factor [bacterium]
MLRDWKDGDEQALEELVPLVYEKLRGLARRELRRDRPGHSLQPTELVHDAYARMVDLELSWQDRVHFYRMAARTMRRVLVDHARARRAEKRGGGAVMVTLSEGHGQPEQPASDVLDLNEALGRLAEQDARLSQAVELYYFGGLTYQEIAHALEVSAATVDRDLRFARAWLRRELAPAAGNAEA